MRGRCDRHQLALGPRGCLRCRREIEAAPRAPAEARPHLASASADGNEARDVPATAGPSLAARQISLRVPTSVLLLPLVAAGFYYLLTAEQLVPRAPVSGAVSATSAPQLQPTADPTLERTARAKLPPLVIEEPARPERFIMAGPAREEPTPETPAPVLPAARADSPARSVTEARRELEARELAALRERVDVIVYFASWCPACRKLRAYLAERGIRSTEYDVDNDSAARARQRALNPRGTIPTVDIEGQVLVGFNARRIEAAIDQAARTRLRRL